MDILRLRKLNTEQTKGISLIVVFCFSLMMLLGVPLHQHDLKHLNLDPNCAPFHLFQSSIIFETSTPDLSPLTQITYKFSLTDSVLNAGESVPTYSRAPPAFC